MINFFKKLFGIKTPCAVPSTPKETVKEILTPPDALSTALTASTYIEPAKPVKKVRAISAPATPNNTKPKAKPNRPVNEGNRRANVKTPNPNSVKPSAPPKPASGKKKARRK